LSTEPVKPIEALSEPAAGSACVACGAPLGVDQRYCLECGERRMPLSEFLLGSAPPGLAKRGEARTTFLPDRPAVAAASPTANGLMLLAGVGVLMLAIGVGVLIGRAGAGQQRAAAPQVITLGSLGTGATSAAGASPTQATFTGDWPAGSSGYTVELQTLPRAGTTPSAVAAAKLAAEAKGAKGVGALDSGEYASLRPGSYVIYAGIEQTKAAATKALGALKKSFPAASVIHVSNAAASGSNSTSPAGASGSGSSLTHPAPPSVLEGLKSTKGKSYVERSKNLPDVIETG
jgi:hypothetical protein